MGLRIEKRNSPGVETYDVFSGDVRVAWIEETMVNPRSYHYGLVFLGGGSPVFVKTLARAKEAVRLAWDEWLKKALLAEMQPPEEPLLNADAVELEIDQIIAEFGGDSRAAIGALLHDMGALALDAQAVVSKGYVRGIAFSAARARRKG